MPRLSFLALKMPIWQQCYLVLAREDARPELPDAFEKKVTEHKKNYDRQVTDFVDLKIGLTLMFNVFYINNYTKLFDKPFEKKIKIAIK